MRHVDNVREVVRQHEAATVAEVDGAAAVLEADVADEADDAASDGAWRNENIGWMRRFFCYPNVPGKVCWKRFLTSYFAAVGQVEVRQSWRVLEHVDVA